MPATPPVEPDPLTDADLDGLLALAHGLVALAGSTVRAGAAGRLGALVRDTKSTSTDLVTQVDTAVEQLVVGALLAVRPGDEVLGEEGGTVGAGTSGVRWLLDPVDGTVNFAYGLPQYAVSLAAEVAGEVVVGVVLDVARGRTFSAARGRGAAVDGTPLRCSAETDLPQALLGTGFSYDAGRRARWGEVLLGVLPHVRDVRRQGSAALDLCAVGEGVLDCYAERDLHPWDLGAGGLVASEAGARVGGLSGRPAGFPLVIAAPPALFDPLQDLLAVARADEDLPAR